MHCAGDGAACGARASAREGHLLVRAELMSARDLRHIPALPHNLLLYNFNSIIVQLNPEQLKPEQDVRPDEGKIIYRD
jgi:hypothetical protein